MGAADEFLARVPRRTDGKRNWRSELKALLGAISERIDLAQFELEMEDIETAIAQVEAEIYADERTAPVRPQKSRQTNRGSLPKHLKRMEVVIEPELFCACGAESHVIGEDVRERLDIVPAQFRVIVTRRPKYACRSCEGGITQAPAPAHIVAGGMPTEATLAHVIVSNLRITCRSIDKLRFTAARESIWIARLWPRGSASQRSS